MAHILELRGGRQAGKTMLALDMLEYASLAGREAVYVLPTQRDCSWLKQKTETSVHLLSYEQLRQKAAAYKFDIAVVDCCGNVPFRAHIEVVRMLEWRMQHSEFAQIIKVLE